MIVTLVSQCEKKALGRTRRILDAFANRIGDNVWQTAITEEGLKTVKQLLRSSATKSTAVSCHRNKTRQLTELVWVVGNKRKFNEVGIVPVNWTNKEVFMDLPITTANILANTNEQPLSQHLFAVGYLGYKLIEKLQINNPKLAQAALIAGILHDIGKLDPQFQEWLKVKIGKEPIDSSDELLPDLPDDGVHIDNSIRGHTKFTFETHPRHHEISWLLAQSILPTDLLNSTQRNQIFHGIYWHHTRPYRKDDKFFTQAKGIHKLFVKSLNSDSMNKVMDELSAVLNDVAEISKGYTDIDFETLLPQWNKGFQLTQEDLPNYKNYDELAEDVDEFTIDIRPNALNNLIRTAVISADRIVSALPAEDLADYIKEGNLEQAIDNIIVEDSDLCHEINKCIAGFNKRHPDSDRNQSQTHSANKLAELKEIAEFDEADNIGVLQGPAGCGKTKIALEWASKTNAKKIIWVCPRVQVCLGLLADLTQSEYLPNSRIEIFTGEYKKILTNTTSMDDVPDTAESDYFSGDIVLTTIDQVINNIISHHKVTTQMTDFMQAHVIFDEFHELIPMSAFNLLFAELVEAKKCLGHNANTLLVSATPHDYFVSEVLGIKDSYIVRADSFNQADYQLDFVSYDETQHPNPLVNDAIDTDKTTFIITNTAQDAQLGFLLHQNDENNVLLHSKYTRSDKAGWFNKVFDSFKKNGNHHYQVLRSGPIVQASLNITCQQMYTDLTSPENWLQRLGRLDRFDENNEPNIYTTVMPDSAKKGKQSSHQAKFLASLCVWNSTVAWLNYLQDYLTENSHATVTLNELYNVYKKFYEDESCREKVAEDIEKTLKQSVSLINAKVIDPISVPPKSKRSKDGAAKISKSSLRGNNRFVQMAVCSVDDELNPTFTNEYAYDESTDHSKVTIGLTESVERLRGHGDGAKDLLVFMQSKHHNIKKSDGVKKAFKDFMLLAEARSPEYPIYLSYTPDDLEPIGGERERHQYAMYYVMTDKQPVGTMPINKLINPNSVDD
ncbi:CRISPR-associated endonuclease Cas3'' [Psychrobacter cryohalolentis]|uniref:CRISPR-associated endonuclease Cas3'' n=1 Tax=Psychrobacter cryohalolentis TaxID=330922 RepID=UPI003F87E23D